jgi:hypothetical protein
MFVVRVITIVLEIGHEIETRFIYLLLQFLRANLSGKGHILLVRKM